MPNMFDFSGIWHSVYHYTSTVKEGNFTSEYDVQIHRSGNQLIMQSKPNEDGSYMLVRLTIDGRILTGTWHEQTAPLKDYKGVAYYGALQLVVDESGKSIHGKYVGFNRQMQVQCGDWELIRKSEEKS